MPRVPSLLTVQSPRVSLVTFEPIVSNRKASEMVRSMIDNPDYAEFKELKNRANAANVRMNLKIAESGLGLEYDSFELQMADVSVPTSRELMKIVSKIFTSKPSHLRANIQDAYETFRVALSSESKGGVKSVEFMPKEPFAQKVEKALDKLLVDRELAKKS